MVNTQQLNHYKTKELNLQERPWGRFEVLHEDNGYKVKRLFISANEKTSLQLHKHRSEHWLIESGVAKITIAEQVLYLMAGASINVPKNTIHRIENEGHEQLVIFEMQFGDMLKEDDIVRIEDKYGRE